MSGDAEKLRALFGKILDEVLKAEVSEYVGAQRHERTARRLTYRNGYKPRSLYTRVGELTLRAAQTRDGGFSTRLFQRYQRHEQAFVLALLEMDVHGVSTRDVARVTQQPCCTRLSRSTVSALTKRLEPIVEAWRVQRRIPARMPAKSARRGASRREWRPMKR
ncbi:MAG: transposase [Clostridia bacterium]|nr:transposase [Clostridia bacterium]